MFRTGRLGSCPGHFGFCGGQPRPGDEVVLLPGLGDPVVVRRRPGPEGRDYYRIVGVTSGIVGGGGIAGVLGGLLGGEGDDGVEGGGDDWDGGLFCERVCGVLDDKGVGGKYKSWEFYLL